MRSLPTVMDVILSRDNSLKKAQNPQRAWPFHGTAVGSSWPSLECAQESVEE